MIVNAFILPHVDSSFNGFFETLYWEIVTISTVGYGDITPHTVYARILTIFLIIFGLIATALFTAYVTTNFLVKIIENLKRWKIMDGVENHVIICGYNFQTNILVKTFLNKSMFKNNQIVLIHHELTSDIENLLEEYQIKFVEGDYSEEETLKKARAFAARRAVLISETLEDDAKVLSAAILLKDFNKNIYIVAEVVNPKFQIYLKKIKCDEIVLSKEYNSYLMAKSTFSPGISKVIEELLKDDRFYIIKNHYQEKKTFKEIKQQCEKENKMIIGIIENYAREEEFIKEVVEEVKREAKRIKDIAKRLEEVKHIEINKVVLYPKDDYIVDKFCGFIVLRR
jgi:voltage-gated potassium channel